MSGALTLSFWLGKTAGQKCKDILLNSLCACNTPVQSTASLVGTRLADQALAARTPGAAQFRTEPRALANIMRKTGFEIFTVCSFLALPVYALEAPAPAPSAPAGVGTAPVPVATAREIAPQPAEQPLTSNPKVEPSSSTVAASPYDSPPAPAVQVADKAPSPPPKQKTYDGPPTLIDFSIDYAIGGYGGVGVMYTRFVNSGVPQVCGEGAVLLDHVLEIGGGGCGITASVDASAYGPEPHQSGDRMRFGYGGGLIRYHFFSHSKVNLGVGALIGAGGISIGVPNDNDDTGEYTHLRSEAVFVFEPHVGAYSNVTRWLRIGAIVGYRLVSGVDMKNLSNSDFSAPTLGGVVQGGWF